jgi:hypothetical protein
MEPVRCRNCRRVVESGSACEDAGDCDLARKAWQFSPCPADRCEFPAAGHAKRETGDSVVWTCPDGWGFRKTH